jgi:anti-sigma regulatory factor (Ser/Thr protein kinase)
MLLNAIEHGGQFDPNKRVYIECGRTKGILIYRVRDPGKGFFSDALRHAAISNLPDAPAAHLQRRMELNMRARIRYSRRPKFSG